MSELPAAIPAFTHDIDDVYAELGKTFVYVKQLSRTLNERAQEANRLDDELRAEQRKAEMFAAELDRLRARNRELEDAEMLRQEVPMPGCACERCED